jgi:hypothetical protein
MNKKIELRFVFLVLILIIVGLCVGHLSKNFVMRQYDAARLANFANRIADADRIVGTYPQTSVSLMLTGDNARKGIQAVSSAVSARMPNSEFACLYDVKATFFKGTNVLGEIRMCGPLFLLNHDQPPFVDGSGLLETVIYTPVQEALREFYQTNVETK